MNTFGKDTESKGHEKDASIAGPNQCERDKPDTVCQWSEKCSTVSTNLLIDTCKYARHRSEFRAQRPPLRDA